jgi:hypothetical protein
MTYGAWPDSTLSSSSTLSGSFDHAGCLHVCGGCHLAPTFFLKWGIFTSTCATRGSCAGRTSDFFSLLNFRIITSAGQMGQLGPGSIPFHCNHLQVMLRPRALANHWASQLLPASAIPEQVESVARFHGRHSIKRVIWIIAGSLRTHSPLRQRPQLHRRAPLRSPPASANVILPAQASFYSMSMCPCTLGSRSCSALPEPARPLYSIASPAW